MRLKHKILLLLIVLISLSGCSADEVPFSTMALIIGLVALAFYGLAIPSVFLGRVMHAKPHIFNTYVLIVISLIVFVGFNALLLLVDPDIAAILFCLVLMCVLGLNLGFFLARLGIMLIGLFAFTAFLALIWLFEIYRPHGFFHFLVNAYRSLR